MSFVQTIAFIALMAIRVSAQTQTDQCDTLEGCYLRNLKTGKEIKLKAAGFKYPVDDATYSEYSIRCDVNGDGDINYVKFFYDGKVHDEFGEPRWMDGDSHEQGYFVPVPYLSNGACGGTKTVTVQGHIWSKQCFEQQFVLQTTCGVVPTAAPIVPTAAPIVTKSPTAAPVVIKTSEPTAAPQDDSSPQPSFDWQTTGSPHPSFIVTTLETPLPTVATPPPSVTAQPATLAPVTKKVATVAPTMAPKKAATVAPITSMPQIRNAETSAPTAAPQSAAPAFSTFTAGPTSAPSASSEKVVPTAAPLTAAPIATAAPIVVSASPISPAPVARTAAKTAAPTTAKTAAPTAAPVFFVLPPAQPSTPTTPGRSCKSACPAGMERTPGAKSCNDCQCKKGHVKRLAGGCRKSASCKKAWWQILRPTC